MIGEGIDRAADRVGDRIASIARSYAFKASAAVLAIVAMLGAAACGLIATFWLLAPEMGPFAAIATIAAALLVIAAVFAIVAARSGRKVEIADAVKPKRVVIDEADAAVETLGPLKFVASAVAVGAMVGATLAGSRRRTWPNGAVASGADTLLSAVSLISSALTAFSITQAGHQSGSQSGHQFNESDGDSRGLDAVSKSSSPATRTTTRRATKPVGGRTKVAARSVKAPAQ